MSPILIVLAMWSQTVSSLAPKNVTGTRTFPGEGGEEGYFTTDIPAYGQGQHVITEDLSKYTKDQTVLNQMIKPGHTLKSRLNSLH